jgi:hypothetical protein
MNNRNSLSWKMLLFATVLYALVFIVYTYPLISNFFTHIIGPARGGDAAQYTWNSYVFKQNLLSGKNLFFTDLIFYPSGTNLWFHTYTPFISIFSLPFTNLFLALNIMTFAQFVLSGIGGLLLSQKLFKNYTWGLIVGFVFSFSTYKMMHLLGHYHLMLSATVPFYIMAFMNAFSFSENKAIPYIKNFAAFGWATCLIFVTFLSDYYATFYLLFFSGLYLLFPFVRTTFLKLSNGYKVSLILILFLAGHFLAKKMELRNMPDRGAYWWLPDFTYFFVPSPRSAWFDTTFYYNLIGGETRANVEMPTFWGWSLLLALLYILVIAYKHQKVKHDKQFYFFVFILLFFIGMVVPQIKILGHRLFYLPTAFYYYTPFLNNIRIPSRASLMVFLFLPMVIGYLWTSYKSFVQKNIYTYAPMVLLCLLIVEYKPQPYKFMCKDLNVKVGEWIKHAPGEVLFPIPLGIEDGMINYGKPDVGLMTDQITHGKKLLGGYASRVNDDVFALYINDSIFSALRILQKKSHTQQEVYKVDAALVVRFLKTFKPDLILIEPTYKNTPAHRFVKLNFAPYIVAEDSLNNNVLYTLKRP